MNEEEKKKLRDINFKVINCLDKLKGLIERDEIIYLFKILEKQQAEIEKKDKIINKMAEQLTTPIHSKEWVKNYYEREIEQ